MDAEDAQTSRASRLYVDLIYQASRHYANTSPSSMQEIGDYGTIDRHSGEFKVAGNVFYDFPEVSSLLEEPWTKEEPQESRCYFKSRENDDASGLNLDGISELKDCELKYGWSVHKGRPAALVLINPVLVEIADEAMFRKLVLKQERLMHQVVITRLYKCTSYAMFLATNVRGAKYHFGFRPTSAASSTSPSDTGSAVVPQSAWIADVDDAWWSAGEYDPGVHQYCPLVTLKDIRGFAPVSKDLLHYDPPDIVIPTAEPTDLPPLYPPWGELDSDGRDLDEDLDARTKDEENSAAGTTLPPPVIYTPPPGMSSRGPIGSAPPAYS